MSAKNTALKLLPMLTKSGLFDKNTNVKAIRPRETLGAGVEELEDRFSDSDANIQENIIKDMQVEDDALVPLIKNNRLESWYESIYDLAKQDCEEVLAEETGDGNKMQEAAFMLETKERELKRREEEKADALLHSKPRFKPKMKVNGKGSFRQLVAY